MVKNFAWRKVISQLNLHAFVTANSHTILYNTYVTTACRTCDVDGRPARALDVDNVVRRYAPVKSDWSSNSSGQQTSNIPSR
jgi:hypothetical protein